jgi:hypothetical protein
MEKFYVVVVACHTAQGTPEFVMTAVKMSENKRNLGMHYEEAEKRAMKNSYEGPMVCFDEAEFPDFLRTAVKKKLIPEV